MSNLTAGVIETREVRTIDAEPRLDAAVTDEFWPDEAFLDSLADIINENFVLDVKACQGIDACTDASRHAGPDFN